MEKARPNQISPDGDWNFWLILAGRGWGKTRTGAEDITDYGLRNPNSRIAVVAPTVGDVRKVCLEGVSGLLSVLPPACIERTNFALGEIHLWNGTVYQTFGAEEPNRLRGPQFHRAWCDELAAWTYPDTFDQLMFGLRLGDHPKCVITTTPKPTPLIKSVMKRSDCLVTTGNTFENAQNLASTALAHLREKYEGTRLGRQELYAEILDDTPGALWRRSDIDDARVSTAPEMLRVVVAIDPAVSTSEGSDETGIVVAGKGTDGRWYVLADVSGRYTPDQWGREAVAAYNRFDADRIIGEVNNGGDMIENTLRNIDRNISYKAVRASKGKVTRAEPVAALYEQKRVSHVGSLATLEDQMCVFTTDYDRARMQYSPDRMDALVWALTELAVEENPGDNLMEYWKRKDALAAAAKP